MSTLNHTMKVIVVRHGHYNDSGGVFGSLSTKGVEQVTNLALSFSRDLNIAFANKVMILSSPVVRARETAQILSEELIAQVIEKSELDEKLIQLEAIEKMVAQHLKEEYEVLIITTHKPVASGLGIIYKGQQIELGHAEHFEFNLSLQDLESYGEETHTMAA